MRRVNAECDRLSRVNADLVAVPFKPMLIADSSVRIERGTIQRYAADEQRKMSGIAYFNRHLLVCKARQWHVQRIVNELAYRFAEPVFHSQRKQVLSHPLYPIFRVCKPLLRPNVRFLYR